MSHALQNKMMVVPTVPDATEAAVLKVLAYFDIFHYPLKRNEIKQFLDTQVSDHALEIILKELLADGIIFLHFDLYSLQNSPLPACKRIQGNLRAAALLPKAHKIGRFLYHFPFVRGIGVSGSLSKNFADDKADIDFFIIAKTNRLWLARTFMHLFKKLTFLTGRQHFYCMNYYIDEEALLLNEQNIFTAMEIKTLLPASGNRAIQQFFSTNQWTNEWLPCCAFRVQDKPDTRRTWVKNFFEWLLDNKLGNSIDNYLMRLTDSRWKRKQEKGRRNKKGQMMGLVTGKHFAKSNPGAFQEKVLTLYREKLDKLKLL